MSALLKRGTMIRTIGCPSIGGMPAVSPEVGRIIRKGDDGLPDGYYLARFEDGARLHIHESGFEVVPQSLTTEQLVAHVKATAPIAKRCPDRRSRDKANATLRALYAELAVRQKAGDHAASVTIDMGAL